MIAALMLGRSAARLIMRLISARSRSRTDFSERLSQEPKLMSLLLLLLRLDRGGAGRESNYEGHILALEAGNTQILLGQIKDFLQLLHSVRESRKESVL